MIAAALLFSAAAVARADESFPTRPITLIVPFAAGGTSDVIARLAAEGMGKALGQSSSTRTRPAPGARRP